jgi:hypothetical protein
MYRSYPGHWLLHLNKSKSIKNTIMKNFYFILILLVATPIIAQSQQKINIPDVEDIERNISVGTAPGIMIFIPGTDSKWVEKEWKKTIFNKGYYSSKSGDPKPTYTVKNGESIAFLTKFDFYSEPLTVYALRAQMEGGVRISAFFSLDSVFVTKENNEELYYSTKTLMRNFMLNGIKEVKNNELETKKKALQKQEKAVIKLKKNREKFEKKIVQSNLDILNYENQVVTNQNDQSMTSERVSNMKVALSALEPNTEARKEAQKRLKAEEKKLKKQVSAQRKLQSKIASRHRTIRAYEDKITRNQNEQERSIKENDENRLMIRQMEERFNEIK